MEKGESLVHKSEESSEADLDRRPLDRLTRRRTRGVISADRNFVTALGRGLLVLETFAEQSVWLSSSEVASRVRLPKPTTSRLLHALNAMGYLHYSRRRRQYRLGAAVLSLGFAARDTFSVGDIVRPYLEGLADEYNIHASLAGRDRLDVIELEVCHSTKTLMTLNLDVGSRIPLAGTATGHALLAALPARECQYLMEHLRHRHSKHWAEILEKIEEGRRQYRERGYTWSVASWRTDINGVAAPFICPGRAQVLVIACGAPARHLPRRKMDEIGRRLTVIVKEVTDKLSSRQAVLTSGP
ncbi:MAG: IclR family transcriptional regulator [Hyphomicrobiaceae bacterium]|nr:IclR family transcriptional regulator [Hyphomicrobiaceae bacterium]